MSAPSAFPAPQIIPPKAKHTHTIVLCHGRGSNGHEFAFDFLPSQSSDNRYLASHFPSTKWVFPTTKSRLSTYLDEEMTEWFDIYSLANPLERQTLQVDGLSEAIAYLHGLVLEEISQLGGDATKLILGGISQGCAVAIHALLAGTHQLGGFVGFCSWLPFSTELKSVADIAQQAPRGQDDSLRKTLDEFYTSTLHVDRSVTSPSPGTEGHPFSESQALDTHCFLSHCTDDKTVDVRLGRDLCGTLQQLGMTVEWGEQPHGGHWVQEPEEVDRLVNFLISKVMIPGLAISDST